MVAAPAALPDVLPTDRLLAGGKAVPELRANLRTIPQWKSAITLALVVLEPVAVVAAAIWLSHPVAWVAAFLLMGRAYARFASLGHEAVHRTLFNNNGLNDWVGRWILSYPSWVPFELYRRAHINHHRDEMGPKEPDVALYANYPVSRASFRRKLLRDATGRTGWKLFVGLVKAARKRKPTAVRILACQIPIIAAFTIVGRPELYFFLWWLPHQTIWRVINRLRAVAEHGGLMQSADRRQTTHDVRQTWLASFWLAPHNIGYHLAHHVDMGVSCWNLPLLHKELVRSGWVSNEYTYRNYRSLWKALSSG
ncbi:MAG: fatty acid desaturase [Acidimicrobiales bacterium]|jgi:fatty acid desaturase